MHEWMHGLINEWMNKWMNDRMNEQMNEWMIEWMNEWSNELKRNVSVVKRLPNKLLGGMFILECVDKCTIEVRIPGHVS